MVVVCVCNDGHTQLSCRSRICAESDNASQNDAVKQQQQQQTWYQAVFRARIPVCEAQREGR